MGQNPNNLEWVQIDDRKYRCVESTYGYSDTSYFSVPYRVGTPGFETLVPEQALQYTTWHRGFGDLFYKDPEAYYTSNGTDASIVNQLTLALAAGTTGMAGGVSVGETMTSFVDFLGKTYGVGSRGVFVWNPAASPNGWSATATFNAPLGQPAIFSAVNGAGTPAIYRFLTVAAGTATQAFFDGTTWTTVGTSVAHFQTIRNELWKAYVDSNGIWQLAKSTDGVTYGSANMIGDGTATVNSLFNYSNQLFLNTTAGVKSIDSNGLFWDILPEVGLYADPTVGQGTGVFHDIAYIPSNRGLLQFTGSSALNITAGSTTLSVGPDVKSQSQAAVRGKVRYVAPHINYAYMTFNSNDNHGYLLKYRDYPDTQPGQGFHPIWTGAGSGAMGAAKVSTLAYYTSQLPYPVLWFSYDRNIYHMDLPLDSDNPLVNSGMMYQTSGTLDIPIYSDNMPSIPKHPIRYYADITATTNTTVTLQASFDGGAFTTVASVTGTQGVVQFNFPNSTPEYFTMQTRIKLDTTNAAATPIVRSLQYHHLVRPQFLQTWHMQLLLQAWSLRQKNETTLGQEKDLRVARNHSSPFIFVDKLGYPHSVTMEKLDVTEIVKEVGEQPTLIASVQLLDRNTLQFYTDAPDSLVGYCYAA